MTQDTQSIAAAKILPRAKVEGLKSCVDLACLTEDRSLLLTGWLYDPNAEVRGLSVLQEDDGGLSKSKTAATGQWLSTLVRFGQRRSARYLVKSSIEHGKDGVQLVRISRPDVANAMRSQSVDDAHGFILIVPEFPVLGKIALEVSGDQYVLLNFTALVEREAILESFKRLTAQYAKQMLPIVRAGLGDANPLTILLRDIPDERSEEDPVWERILERCRHEREIVKVYGSKMRPRSDHPSSGRPIVVLVFTNRSGSNFLCDCLGATGKFELAGEALNWEIVAKRTAQRNIQSFPEYCLQQIAEIGDPARHVVVKASLCQFVMLWKYGILGPQGLFRNTKYVHIERRDVLAQSVSHSIADQTRQFTSRQDKKKPSPEFDPDDICRRLAAIVQQNAMAEEFFSTIEVSVFRAVYETLVNERSKVLMQLAEFLEIEALEIDKAEIALERQSTQINDEFKRQYRQLMTTNFRNWAGWD